MVFLVILVAVAAAYAAHRYKKKRQIGSVGTPMQVAPVISRDPVNRMGTRRRR